MINHEISGVKRANSGLIGDPLVAWIDDPGTTDQDVQDEIGLNPWIENFGATKSEVPISSL